MYLIPGSSAPHVRHHRNYALTCYSSHVTVEIDAFCDMIVSIMQISGAESRAERGTPQLGRKRLPAPRINRVDWNKRCSNEARLVKQGRKEVGNGI